MKRENKKEKKRKYKDIKKMSFDKRRKQKQRKLLNKNK